MCRFWKVELYFYFLCFHQVEYNHQEVNELLRRIDHGNRLKSSKAIDKNSMGLKHRGSAFGILGT